MDAMRVGFVGTGVMGASMARRLIEAGYRLHVFNRTRQRAAPLAEQGAILCDSVAELASQVDVVFSIVGFPGDVEEVYFGESGILENLRAGGIAVDMTTSSPLLAQRIEVAGKEKGIQVLDAPVSGGDIGAREGRLSIMVGGERGCYETVLPLFERMGKNIVLQGPAGSGQHTKMCNQIAIASGMVALRESLAYARAAGLDAERLLLSIGAGAAGSWSMENLVPRALAGDFSPGFFIKHFIKDMGIALEVAAEMQLDLPGLALAKSLYESLAASGHENLGTQALLADPADLEKS